MSPERSLLSQEALFNTLKIQSDYVAQEYSAILNRALTIITDTHTLTITPTTAVVHNNQMREDFSAITNYERIKDATISFITHQSDLF